MHNATTKQRLSALRRKLGIFTGAPRWVRERRRRLVELGAAAAGALGFSRSGGNGREQTPALATAMPRAGGGSASWMSRSAVAPEPAAPRQSPRIAPPEVEPEVARPEAVEPDDATQPAPWAHPAAPAQPAGATRFVSAASAATVPAATVQPSPAAPAQPAAAMQLSPAAPAQPAGAARSIAAPQAEASEPPEAAKLSASEPAPASRGKILPILIALLVVAGAAILIALLRTPAAPQPTAATVPAAAPPVERAAPPVESAVPAAAAAAAPAPAGSIEVHSGDTLWHLAARHLGDPTAWPKLYELNRGQIQDPDLIFPGQQLALPGR